MRSTIDFGIDLGTTNSAIAVLTGRTTEVIKNAESLEYTPSAIWLDKKGNLFVGRTAKERLEQDPENAVCEFKLQMGTTEGFKFRNTGRSMLPEELSAEIIKSIRADVKQRLDEELESAVITVPAAFELPQCAKTHEAARLAGLKNTVLLQEPVAAALSYGFQDQAKAYRLVYDLGGGTFDAALVHATDGTLTVVNHGGYNHLGGKLIDWDIVEKVLVPAFDLQQMLPDFSRGNPRWRSAFAKLKFEAEKAKIRLSREESTNIFIEHLCAGETGASIPFEYDVTRKEVESLLEPRLRQSIRICKKVLHDARMSPQDVERVLLVGGPTLTPFLRGMLADSSEGLGIPIEFSQDPLTVVARGAAIHAGTQQTKASATTRSRGALTIEFKYQPVGNDLEPYVAGRLTSDSPINFAGFTVEFTNPTMQPPWRGGKLPVSNSGVFTAQLFAAKDAVNTYEVEVLDSAGRPAKAEPNRLCYTFGTVVTEQRLINSIGLVLANDDVEWLLRKGTPLPGKSRRVKKLTTVPVRAGQTSEAIRVLVIEGENERGDRNPGVGSLIIDGQKLKRDLPIGTPVEIVVELDESRLLTTRAFIPYIDEEFEGVLKLEKKAPSPQVLKQKCEVEQTRLGQLRSKAGSRYVLGVDEILLQLDAEKVVADVESALQAAANDRDAADKCEKRLLDLREALDQVEELMDWPSLLEDVEGAIGLAHQLIDRLGLINERLRLSMLEEETEKAKSTKRSDVLRRKLRDLQMFVFGLLAQDPSYWSRQFDQLSGNRGQFKDLLQADAFIAQGRRCLQNGDRIGLEAAVRQLWSLLPEEIVDRIQHPDRSTLQ
jgi:molecular chaperone DnaK